MTEPILSRGKDSGEHPVIQRGVSLKVGSSYVRELYRSRASTGGDDDISTVMSEYDRHVAELGRHYEPSLDIYVAWCNSLVRESEHKKGRVFFKRGGQEYVFSGGGNNYQVLEVDTPDEAV